MKLFIDDIRNAPDDTWVVARTNTEAIRIMYTNRDRITHISFDHDCGDSNESFQASAYYLALLIELLQDYLPVITVHSANPIGVEKIKSILNLNMPKINTVQIVLFINGRELMRTYELDEDGMLPDGMQEHLQDMVDAIGTDVPNEVYPEMPQFEGTREMLNNL
jgi:hypothetical protein